MKNLNLTLILLFLAVISFAQNVPSYVPTNGLVGWWPFNGNANDESGNGNNGTVNGATLTVDRYGNASKAYSFDGNDWIEVNNNLNQNVGAGSFTLSCWALKAGSNNIHHLITRNQATSNQDAISSYILRYQFNTIATSGPSSAPANLNNGGCTTPQINNLNNWNSIVAVFDSASATYSIYQNGALISSCNITQNINSFNNNGKIYFGVENPTASFVSGPLFLTGNIDDIGIWNRALTQQEIADLYNGNICYQNITVTDTLLINTNITGYNPVSYENTIRIWPNPTYDHITIDAGNLNTMSGYSIRIVNALGQQVFQSAINQQQFYLDLSNWTGNGIYYVNIINPQGVTIDTRKIVLQ